MSETRNSSRTPRTAALAFAVAWASVAGNASADPQMSAVSGQLEEHKPQFVTEGTNKRLTQLQELMTS